MSQVLRSLWPVPVCKQKGGVSWSGKSQTLVWRIFMLCNYIHPSLSVSPNKAL